ncbi:hypothetical protein [uncultured Methanobrevibacter sp.]|uniref:hypothetical protein n=1 Tax=uncultured Methanobrevibacter sp. TaxID=253161 RepID=UPI0025FA73CD|nr:hypothetical protein [uncultured Methanobrevibacter sp.]
MPNFLVNILDYFKLASEINPDEFEYYITLPKYQALGNYDEALYYMNKIKT